MEDLIIREMDFEDYPSVMELWKVCDLPYKPDGRDHPDSIRREMKERQNSFLVAEIEGKIIGSILATHDGRKGWINRLGVRLEYRNQGVGRALVDEAEKWMQERGIGIFTCLIEEDNAESVKVFESLGYEKFEGVYYFTKRTRPDI
jgi:ribosomal protein S18 acetylase RimI-like enzyme